MACDCSSVEEKMADLEKSFDLDAPANILRYEVLRKLSMQLSIVGTLASWKDVADKLGFSNLEISGHYQNFTGSDSAMTMMNDWIHKRKGKIRDLVRVFLSLELHSCLEELKEDLEKYDQQSKEIPNVNNDKNEGISTRNDRLSNTTAAPSSTSGPESCQTDYSSISPLRSTSVSSSIVDSSLQSTGSSAMTSLQSDTSVESLPCPYLSTPTDSISSTQSSMVSSPVPKSKDTSLQSEVFSENYTNSSAMPQQCPSVSLIQERAWPETGRDYKRSTSVPHERLNKVKPKSKRYFFKRSKSLDPDKKTHKRKPLLSWPRFRKDSKKNEQLKSKDSVTGKNITVEATDGGDTSFTVQGIYTEEASPLKENFSPLRVSEEKPARPVSSGSDESDQSSPSSPTSPGYDSGYHSGDNSFKRIYIVCNPDDEVIFQRAVKLYLKFCKKGYECHMFATDLKGVMEVGRFRYEMQQVRDADFVFICVSKTLKEIFEGRLSKAQMLKDDDAKGLRHVSDFMMTFFANDCCNKNGKFMPIILTDDAYDHVPFVMSSYLKYKWPAQEKRMENTIHQRSEIPPPPVSSSKLFAPVKVCTSKGIVKASVRDHDTCTSG